MALTEILSLLGLAAGAALGLIGLIAPDRAAGIVRLQPDPSRGGGYSEFRATYGGLFLAVHAAAFLLVLGTGTQTSALIVLPVAAGWLGAAAARVVSVLMDRPRLGDISVIPVWMMTELGLALAIGAPLLHLVG